MSRPTRRPLVACAPLFARRVRRPRGRPGAAHGPRPGHTRAPTPTRTRARRRADAERLQRVMTPLIRAMNNPRPLGNVKVGIMDDPQHQCRERRQRRVLRDARAAREGQRPAADGRPRARDRARRPEPRGEGAAPRRGLNIGVVDPRPAHPGQRRAHADRRPADRARIQPAGGVLRRTRTARSCCAGSARRSRS